MDPKEVSAGKLMLVKAALLTIVLQKKNKIKKRRGKKERTCCQKLQ
jgi:hypothetical protein